MAVSLMHWERVCGLLLRLVTEMQMLNSRSKNEHGPERFTYEHMLLRYVEGFQK